MGQSLARNIAEKGFKVLGWDRHKEKSLAFLEEYPNKNLDYCPDFKCLSQRLKTPRKYLLMVPAGAPVDEVIKKLSPQLKKGDIIIDGGNSNYKETIRRSQALKKKGVEFVGMGVSGGEEGALRGPSIMPGGSAKNWKALSPILKKIAAKDFAGKPCVTHIGTDGAGHYVKMVHNGIEYGVMQMMAEAYQTLKEIYRLKPNEIAKIFAKYNKGKLKSYLFEIAIPVLEQKDEFRKGFLIDYILDKAGQKGTGRWVAIDALERGATLPTITQAVFARTLSSQKPQRVKLSTLYSKPQSKFSIPQAKFIRLLEDALYAGMISAYAQGFELMSIAAKEQNWKLNFAEIARIWEGGCIIRADLLNFLHRAFLKKKGKPVHLFEIREIRTALRRDLTAWRELVSHTTKMGVAMPALASSLNYFEDMTSERIPANFIQGLRDYFGAHTYERIDKKGIFHTPWSNLKF